MSLRSIVLLLFLVTRVSAQFHNCTGNASFIGDGHCDAFNNNVECEYDGGDCCFCSCPEGEEYNCGELGFDCQDPAYLGAELSDCDGEQDIDVPCSTDAATQWTVKDTASATALAAAIRCSGGAFDVQWIGHVTVNRTIEVANRTVLNINGLGSGAGMQAAPGTRLMTVINASLDIDSMKIDGGYANFGGAIAAFNSSIVLKNTSFSGNNALVEGGALYATFGSIDFEGESTLFNSNHAVYRGGALSIRGGRNVTFHGNTSFMSNTADVDGGALFIYKSTASWAGDALFSKNTAKQWGGALDIASSTASWAGDALFFDSTAGDPRGAPGDAVSSNISNWGGAVHVWNSTLSWSRDAIFSNNTACVWGGAMDIASSTVSWAGKTTFSNNTANEWGGALHTWNSTLSWVGDTVFSRNIASEGGALQASSSTIFLAGGSNFSDNAAGHRGGAMDVWDSTVSLAGEAVFSDNIATYRGGAGHIASSDVSWEGNCFFLNNNCTGRGGALFVFSSVVSWRTSASFLNNSAGSNGGALYLAHETRAVWELGTVLFRNNSAFGDGGAIFVYGSFKEGSSSVDIKSSAKFLNNHCQGDGGALVVLAVASVKFATEGVTFSHNSAHASGGAVAVKGLAVGPMFTGLTFRSNRAQIGGAVYVTSSGTAIRENELGDPIQNPTTFDQCKFIGNEATATGGAIDTGAGLDVIANTSFEGNAARAGGALRLAGITSLNNCTFTENTSHKEGPAISNVGFVSSMTACLFQNNVFICKLGEFLDFEETKNVSKVFDVVCKGCNPEEPRYNASPETPACIKELKHTTSRGGNTTIETLEIDSSYWRATNTSRKMLACYNAGACLGGVTGTPDFCDTGYEGPYCSICSDDYSPGIGHTCSKCSGSVESVVITAIIAISSVILFVFILLSNLWYGKSTGVAQGLLASWRRRLLSLKIIVIVWQVMTQFASVTDVVYPDVYQRFLGGLDVLNFDLSWVLSAECAIDLDFHHRLMMSTLGPLLALAILGGMYAMALRRNRASCDDLLVSAREKLRRKYLSLVLLVTFLVYSPVSSTLFRMYSCDELDDGKSYLRADYRIDCNSSTHKAFQAYAGCMMVIYTGGIPALYGTLLFRIRQVLMDERDRKEDAVAKSISNLWELYKPNRYFYELIECARRILLAGVVVFIFPNTAAQVGIVLMIAAFFMVLSEVLDSYESVWDAWVNRIGHAIIFSSIYLALLLKIDVSDEREESQSVFEAIILAAHAFMFFLAMFEGVVVTSHWIRRAG